MNKQYPTDELTSNMHSELQVSKKTDQKHIIWTALDSIADGDMTRAEAMKEYGVTEKELKKHKKAWKALE